MNVIAWIGKGAEIAGAAVAPALAASLGDPSGGMLAQAGVVFTKEVTDFMQRQQSDKEHQRSAAALIAASQKIQIRLDNGHKIRDDEFFRIRTGSLTTAQVVLDGVLTKAKFQYEVRKALLLGNLLANATFDDSFSADDLSWMIARIDSLTYRHLLIIAYFCSYKISPWTSNNIKQIYGRGPVVFAQIQELRSIGLLSDHTTFETQIEISPSGRLLVGATDLLEELVSYGDEIREIISDPQKGLGEL